MRQTDVQQLIDREEYPSVSVYMPTHRAHPENQQDAIRLKNLLSEARRRLDEEVGKRPSWPIVDQLERLAEDINWLENQDGLALFASDSYATAVRLPFTVEERVTVDRSFETRELMAAFQRLPHYYVLSLAEQPTRLFRGDGPDLEELREHGFPVNASGAPGATRRPDAPQMQRSNVREAHLQEFYREVDSALAEAMANDPLPVVVIGAHSAVVVFDEVTRHRERVIGRVEGSHDEANAAAIAELAWPEVERWLWERREAAVRELGEARGANRLAAGIDDVWNSARAGRGARLVVEQGYRQPAVIQRETGAIELVRRGSGGTGPRHLDDAVDEIAEVVTEKGGEVLFVDDGSLNDYGRIALVLRY